MRCARKLVERRPRCFMGADCEGRKYSWEGSLPEIYSPAGLKVLVGGSSLSLYNQGGSRAAKNAQSIGYLVVPLPMRELELLVLPFWVGRWWALLGWRWHPCDVITLLIAYIGICDRHAGSRWCDIWCPTPAGIRRQTPLHRSRGTCIPRPELPTSHCRAQLDFRNTPLPRQTCLTTFTMSSPDEKTPDQPPAESPAPEAGAGASQPADAESRLDIAKRFLEEASVKDSPREKKVDFLRSKDVTDEEIESLLGKEPVQETTPPAEVCRPPPSLRLVAL